VGDGKKIVVRDDEILKVLRIEPGRGGGVPAGGGVGAGRSVNGTTSSVCASTERPENSSITPAATSPCNTSRRVRSVDMIGSFV
jgi:hypothetical protein